MTVDEIYEMIGQNVYNAIPVDEWEKAEVLFRGDNHAIHTEGVYYSKGEKRALDVHEFDVAIEFALMRLHKKMMPADKSNPWNRAVFTLLPSGEFNMEFSLVEEEEGE